MSLRLLKWRELCTTFSLQEQIKIVNLLSENNIPAKVEVKSSRDRLARDVIFGANPAAANSAGLRTEAINSYIIYTSKDDYDEAKRLINK